MEEKATYFALREISPEKRPFIISRSTFPSSGRWTGHWVDIVLQFNFALMSFPQQLGDNFSLWSYLRHSIAVSGMILMTLFCD
jgi:alpha-glucosidase